MRLLGRAPGSEGAGDYHILRAAEDSTCALVVDRNARAAPEILHQRPGEFVLIDGDTYAGLPATDAGNLLLDAARRDRIGETLAGIDAAAHFAIHDGARDATVIARDAMGLVPCYFTFVDGALVWATHLGGLLPFLDRRRINAAALDCFMASGYIPAPWTMAVGIEALEPGQLLSYRPGRDPVRERYWHPPAAEPERPDSTEVVRLLRDLLPAAVERRLKGDRQPKILLSGGVDSKLLTAICCRNLGLKPDTYTYEYQRYDGRFNEGEEASRTAAHFGLKHHLVRLAPEQIAERLDHLVGVFGQPFSYGLHSAVMDDLGSGGSTRVLAGTAADSYFLEFQVRNAERLRQLPAPARAALGLAARGGVALSALLIRLGRSGEIPKVGRKLRHFRDGLWSYRTGFPSLLAAYMAPAALRQRIYRNPNGLAAARQQKARLFGEMRDSLADSSPGGLGRQLGMRYYGAEMMHNWNFHLSRSVGASIHAPYCDRALLDRMFRWNLSGKGKPELRALAREMMPDEMADAPKIAQGIPIRTWFAGPLRNFLRDQLSDEALDAGQVFKAEPLRALIDRPLPPGVADSDWTLWNALCITRWQALYKVDAA